MDAVNHLDLVVSDIETSLAFYRGLLGPLGYVREAVIAGERGEPVTYFNRVTGGGSVSLRQCQSDAHAVSLMTAMRSASITSHSPLRHARWSTSDHAG